MKEFSENLKNIRESRKISRIEMARKLGISQSGYLFYENGRNEIGDREPTFANLIKIADIFNVSLDELLDYHVNEFERCKNLWIDAGGEVTVTKKKLDINAPDLFAGYTHEDYKNGYGYEIWLRQKDTDRVAGATGAIFLHKEDFIKFTKRIEKKCQQSIFQNAVNMLFAPKPNNVAIA